MLDYKKIVDIINQMGYKTYHFDYGIYSRYIDVALKWYSGYDAAFHREKVFNGFSEVVYEKSRLNMAKKICEDHASLTVNNNINLVMNDGAERDYLLGTNEMTGLLGQENFWNDSARLYELTCALGTGAYEIVVDNMIKTGDRIIGGEQSKLNIIVHNAESIIPLSWDSSFNITEVAFCDMYTLKGEKYCNLRLHILEHNNYKVINKKLKVFGDNYSIVATDSDIIEELDTRSNIPWFSILKLPIVNNVDIYCPLGASIYMNSLDLLRSCDEAFNILTTEFKYGNKILFYNKVLLERDKESGEPVPPNDRNKTFYVYMGDNLNANNEALGADKLIKEFNPELRIDDITKGLNSNLNYLSTNVGLGNNYYKYENGSVQKTATEVVSENSSMYRNIKKNEGAVEKCWTSLFRSILYITNLVKNTNYNIDVPIQIEFDASIIEDKTAIRERDLREVQLGIMTIDEYRNKYYLDRRDAAEIKNDVDTE